MELSPLGSQLFLSPNALFLLPLLFEEAFPLFGLQVLAVHSLGFLADAVVLPLRCLDQELVTGF